MRTVKIVSDGTTELIWCPRCGVDKSRKSFTGKKRPIEKSYWCDDCNAMLVEQPKEEKEVAKALSIPECYPYGHKRIEEMSLHSKTARSSLAAKLYCMIQDYGIALSPDVLIVTVKEMIEHLEEEEYRYIADIFTFFDLPMINTQTQSTQEELDEGHKKLEKDLPVIAKGKSLDVLKAAKGETDEQKTDECCGDSTPFRANHERIVE